MIGGQQDKKYQRYEHSYKIQKKDTLYQQRKKRAKFRIRAAIESIIGHLKAQFRIKRDYLHAATSPKINAMLSAIAWSLKKSMKKVKEELIHFFSPFFNPCFSI